MEMSVTEDYSQTDFISIARSIEAALSTVKNDFPEVFDPKVERILIIQSHNRISA